jgi:2-methylcitrate dehydratase PrpD
VRSRVGVTVDPALGKAQARVGIVLRDGKKVETFVEHAVGSVKNPMSDRALEDKFRGLADGILASERASRLIDLCWGVERLPDAGEVARSAASG